VLLQIETIYERVSGNTTTANVCFCLALCAPPPQESAQ
jgi:hypothetical protein